LRGRGNRRELVLKADQGGRRVFGRPQEGLDGDPYTKIGSTTSPWPQTSGLMMPRAFALCRDQKLPIRSSRIFKHGALSAW
jgi:hypothetical protein